MSKFIPNSFQVPNAFVDEVLDKISDSACKIYLVICRKTRGWNKEMDSISLSQFEDITGKSRPTIVKCLKELIKVGLVIEEESTIHGNTFKLGNETSIGCVLNFPCKNSLLGELEAGSKNSLPLLVKNFNHASKNILPLLVKIFNTQSITIKNNSQSNKKINKKDSAEQPESKKSESQKPEKFDFKNALIENGVSEKLATEFMQVRKAKGGVSTERAFSILSKQIEKANLTFVQAIEFCLNRQKPWAAFEAQWYFNEQNRTSQPQQTKQPYQRRFGNSQQQTPVMRDVVGEHA
ncbi:replication protein [Acinetobacter guerrae]|uniref:replication protein n=1 Tax=Acinetobacter guerrae TaxID=1843371 RepID=UPI00125F4489|nr:replication protein [Acinetobacter guerrae]